MEELAYSLHLGSDKNKKNISRSKAKNNTSGTTSLSNNAIQNARILSKVDNHNYRKYDNEQDNIQIIKGTSSLYNDVKDLYKSEFEESRIEYNSKQVRKARMIDDYFTNVSNNEKNDLACEIIIELGDKKYWNTKDIEFKKRMTSVYKNQIEDLEKMLPNFRIASAIIHYDETSPHLHIVGVPIKYKNKNGMSKQAGKSDVFTKESLRILQDKMRILCIESFNKEYGLNNFLKKKQKGRNKDFHISEMADYQEIKDEIEKNKSNLDKANKQSLELDNSSKDVKVKLNNLKPTILNKDNYILSSDDKNKIISYIDKVDNTNNEYKNIQKLSITLTNVNEKLESNKEKIKMLTENNNALSLRVDTLTKSNKKKDNQIDDLKDENKILKGQLEFWKNKFNKVINFIKDRIFHKKDRDKYYDVSVDLYEHGIIDSNTIYDLKDTYDWNKEQDERKSRDKDDFEL